MNKYHYNINRTTTAARSLSEIDSPIEEIKELIETMQELIGEVEDILIRGEEGIHET